MDFLFLIMIWLSVLAIILFVIYLIFNLRKKVKIKDKLKKIDTTSKLLAIDELRRIIKRDTNNYLAREKLADLLIDNKSYLLAIKEYLVILDHSLNNDKIDEIKFLSKIGSTYLKIQNYEEAKKYFLIIKSKDEFNYEANINLAEIELSNNNFEKSELYFNTAFQIDPEKNDNLKSFGICLYNLNKFNQAIVKFEKCLSVDNNDPELIYYLAYSYYNLTRIDDATKHFNMLKNNNGYAFDAFNMLGTIHKDQSAFIQAIEDYNNALIVGKSIEPAKILNIYYNLADCNIKTHNINAAVELWKKISEVDPNYKDINVKLDNYGQVMNNSLLEAYLIGSVNQFIKICQLIAKFYIVHFSALKGGNINFIESTTTQDSTLQVVAEVTSGNFIETYFFVFIRSTTTVGDMTLRAMYNILKEKKADKGICITAGIFSDSAKEFVESRMLKIVEKDKLMEILNKISASIKKK